MATISSFLTGQQTTVLVGGRIAFTENTLDFSATNAAAADVVEGLNIPNGAVIIDYYTEVVTAEGGVATGDVGDAADPNGLDDAVDFNVAAFTSTIKGTDAYAIGRRYTADDTIDLTLDDALDAAVIRMYAIYLVTEL